MLDSFADLRPGRHAAPAAPAAAISWTVLQNSYAAGGPQFRPSAAGGAAGVASPATAGML